MNLGDVWGVAEPKRPTTKQRQEKSRADEQQEAWTWLIKAVDVEYTRLVTTTYTAQAASKTLREYLGVKILTWDHVLAKTPVIPGEFRAHVLEVKAKMEVYTR